jgi:hypothetical protein
VTDKERDHQIDVLSLILGVTIGALRELGYFTVEEASRLIRIVKREDAEAEDA